MMTELGGERAQLSLTVNGERERLEVMASTTLAQALRDTLGLTGTKVACDRGECGACTTIVDGRAVLSCSMLALSAAGARVETIEGMGGGGGALSAVQRAFLEQDAMQCGYCTPGFIVAAEALLRETPRPSAGQVVEGLSGNICRCGCYNQIVAAVLQASGGAGEAAS